MADTTSNTTPAFSIERELAALEDASFAAIVRDRLDQLDAALQQISPYTLRDDSRLAYNVASGRMRNWSVWDAAHEMACTQFLCDSIPSYQPMLQPYLKGLAGMMKQSTGASWTAVWKSVAELGPEMLKMDLMLQNSICMPNFTPSGGVMVVDGEAGEVK